MGWSRHYFRGVALIVCCVFSSTINAANLAVTLKDNKQKNLPNAVVYLEALVPAKKAKLKALPKGFIRQRKKSYIPHISVFQKGTPVAFVNQDPHKHHVYSFSKAKTFEIKLYSGKPPKSIVFDKVGSVTLGCNIHDQMLAYSYIVDTPFYALSGGNGKAVINGIPDGKYRLKIWHPHQKNGKLLEEVINIPNKTGTLSFQLALKPQWKIKRKKRVESAADEDYLF